MVYGIMSILIFVVAVICKYSKKCDDNTFLFISGFILLLVSALRAPSVGADLERYISIFSRIGEVPFKDIIRIRQIYWDIDKEVGFNYFCKAIYCISNNSEFFVFVTSLIIIGGAIWIIHKFSHNYYLSIFIYILFGRYAAALNVLRSCIAISLCGIALYYLVNKKEIEFFIFLIIATLFQKTALSFILIYPLSKIKIRYSYILFIAILDVILYFFGKEIIILVARIFSYEDSLVKLGQGAGDGLLLMILATLISTAFFWKSYSQNDKNAEIWIHMMLIASMFLVLSMHLGLIIRVVDLFSFYICILIPNVICSLKRTNRVFGYSLVILAMLFYGCYYVYRLDDLGSNIYPYVFNRFL